MPALSQSRHETFAWAIAEGLSPEAAYERAGYASGNGHGPRLLEKPEILARIEEVRPQALARLEKERARLAEVRAKAEAQRLEVAGAARRSVVAALLRLAEREDLKGPAGVREARETLLEAFRLAGPFDLDEKAIGYGR
jgi:hypothetical protein